MGIRVNLSEAVEYDALPAGAYHVAVTNVEYKEAASEGKFPGINWEMTVQGGPHASRKVWNFTTLKPEGLFKLKEMLRALGEKDVDSDMDLELGQYLNKDLNVALEQTTYNGRLINSVESVTAYTPKTRGR